MRPSSTIARRSWAQDRLHVRAGSTRSRADFGARELVAILGPDAGTAAGLTGHRRREYITSRAWVRDIVQRELGQRWHGFEVVPRGQKPRLHRSPLDVSIAHAGDALVVAVVPGGRVGIDIEAVSAVFDQPALIRRLCTPDERETLDRLPATARRAWLTQLWSTKEAYAKALGLGLALNFTEVSAAALARRADVRHVLTPATGDAHLKMAITWVDDAPATSTSRSRGA